MLNLNVFENGEKSSTSLYIGSKVEWIGQNLFLWLNDAKLKAQILEPLYGDCSLAGVVV